MLRKLFKNEFSATWKIMVCIFAVTLGLAEIRALFDRTGFLETSLANTPFVDVAIKVLTFFFVVAMLILTAFCFIICAIRFYKTMYSEQGYLTHTLPVSPIASFFVKVVTSFVWIFSSVICFVLALVIQIAAEEKTNLFSVIVELVKGLGNKANIAELNASIEPVLGCGVWGLLGCLLTFVVVAILYSIFWIYTSFTIGQLSNDHKVAWSVVAGFGLYIFGQILSLIGVVKIFQKFGLDFMESIESAEALNMKAIQFFWLAILVFAVIIVVETIVDCIIVKKKINLQ